MTTYNNNDYIDTRDLLDELADLGVPDWQNPGDYEGVEAADLGRVNDIVKLFDEISGYAGDRPEDGIQLIADDYFTSAMRELVQDCGYLPSELPGFIEYNIDWDGV